MKTTQESICQMPPTQTSFIYFIFASFQHLYLLIFASVHQSTELSSTTMGQIVLVHSHSEFLCHSGSSWIIELFISIFLIDLFLDLDSVLKSFPVFSFLP